MIIVSNWTATQKAAHLRLKTNIYTMAGVLNIYTWLEFHKPKNAWRSATGKKAQTAQTLRCQEIDGWQIKIVFRQIPNIQLCLKVCNITSVTSEASDDLRKCLRRSSRWSASAVCTLPGNPPQRTCKWEDFKKMFWCQAVGRSDQCWLSVGCVGVPCREP